MLLGYYSAYGEIGGVMWRLRRHITPPAFQFPCNLSCYVFSKIKDRLGNIILAANFVFYLHLSIPVIEPQKRY